MSLIQGKERHCMIKELLIAQVSICRRMTVCRENYGFKSYMIGIPTKDCPESVWEDIIRRNVDSYIAGFIQDIECLENQPM